MERRHLRGGSSQIRGVFFGLVLVGRFVGGEKGRKGREENCPLLRSEKNRDSFTEGRKGLRKLEKSCRSSSSGSSGSSGSGEVSR
jgi:hypothetical protein